MPTEGLTTLVGYVGDSEDSGKIRLYVDLTFSNYFEFDGSAVTKTSAVDKADPDSPSILWLPTTTAISFISISRTSGEAAYVTGAIRSRFADAPRRSIHPADEVSEAICSLFCPTQVPQRTDNPWECSTVSQACTTDIFCGHPV